MATNTTNYNLVKPDPNDNYDISVQNANMDAIDEQLEANASGVADSIPKSLATAANLFLVSSALGEWAVKTVAQIKTQLGLKGAAYKEVGDFAAATHKSAHATAGADRLYPSDIGAAVAYNGTATLTAASWSGAAAPYSNTIPVAGILATDYGEVGVVHTSDEAANKVLDDAWSAAQVRVYSSAGAINLVARGTKPTVNIPIFYWGAR